MSRMIFDVPKPVEPQKNPTPEISSAPYRHSVVDSKKTPIETIVSFIGGSNFLTNYYSQVFTKSEELKAFDPHSLNVYQQYHKINNFIIKLQGALSGGDESSSNGRYTLTGRAIIPPLPNLIPNYGDVIIADIGEGRAGQFTVTAVRKMSHNQAAAWEIDFGMERLADAHIVGLLDGKVQRETWYQKDYLITGQNPLLTTEDFNASKTLDEWYRIIARQICTGFRSIQTQTLTVPGQDQYTYDPFVAKIMSRITDRFITPEISSLTLYNVDDYRIPYHQDIYSAILVQDPTLLYSTFREFRSLPAEAMFTSPYQNPIRTTGVKRVVVPYDTQLDNDGFKGLLELIKHRGDPTRPGINASIGTGTRYGLDGCGCSNEHNPYFKNKKPAPPSSVTDAGMDIPLITNDSYVVSMAFYERDLPECTRFERDLWNVLERKPVEREHIYQYCSCFHQWGRLERFYLGPLLLMMIKHALKGL